MNVEIKGYLNHSLQFNETESKLKTELLEEVPSSIIDIHTHIGLREDAQALDPHLLANLITTYPYFSHEQHLQTREHLWHDKEVRQVIFCFPFRGIDIRRGNDYVQTIVNSDSSFIPFLTGEPQDVGYCVEELRTGKWRGIKMYPEQLWPSGERIADFYPDAVLKELDRQSLPAIVHLPHELTIDVPELLDLAQSFSQMAFVVAHFGMARGKFREIEDALRALQNQENIYLDSSWYSEVAIIARALELLGPERILYGSDQPLNLIRAEFFTHPELGKRVLTDFNYHWANEEEQKSYKETSGLKPSSLPNMHFRSLRALLTAISLVYSNEEFKDEVKEKIFKKNAEAIMEGK